MPPAPPPTTGFALPDDPLLRDLLAVSLTGVNVLSPLYDAAGALTDFALDYLNPAAQRMARLPERPGGTLCTHFPHSRAQGVFDFYREVYESGQPGRFSVNYQHDGLDNYFQLGACRSGERLLVSLSDTADQPRSAVEVALRESQAAEKQARAEAELQRQRFYEVLMALPAPVATYHGPDHVYNFVNAAYQRYFPTHALPGRALREVLPETETQGVLAVMDRVYQTGEPSYQQELEVWLDFSGEGRPRQLFLNLFFHPLRDAQGRVDGLLDFSYDVTEQVLARRQVEQLNHELEAHVRARTQEAEAARAEAEAQRRRLERFFHQVPAAVCVHDGPELTYELVNAAYQRFFPDRDLLGKPLLAALPEAVGLEAYRTMRRVYETGETLAAAGLLIPLLNAAGEPEEHYFDLVQQARYDEHGQVDGVLVFAVEVTEQVQARRQAEKLQAELLAAAERQAEQRQALYQVFEETPAFICILRGPEHRYEYFNTAYQRQFAGRELRRGRSVAEVAPETAEQGFIVLLDGVYQTGQTYFGQELPLALAQPDGAPPRVTYFNFTYQAYRENGQTVGVCVFAYDVTEQVLVRQERETQRRQLQAVFEQAPVAVCVFRGPDYVLELVNPPMAQMLGRPQAELLGRPFFDALPELRAQGVPALLDAVRTSGVPFVAQERPWQLAHHPAGQPSYYNFVYEPLREGAAVAGVVCVASDVTEQVLARRRTEEAAAELRLLTARAPAFLFRTNPVGRITYMNEAYFEWTGLDRARMAALEEAWEAVHPDDRPALEPQFGAAIGAIQPWESPVYRLRRRDGQYRWAFSRTQPVFGPGGELTGHTGLTLEIHEQVELQRVLSRTNADLDNFIYAASHDLRQPIQNIEGLLQALREELPPAALTGPSGQVLGLMQNAVDRFQRTVEHLTDVSRLQQAHAQRPEPVDLAALVDDVRQDLAPLIAQTGAVLAVDVAACAPVSFSVKNLRSIVYNLLSNALKYRHPDRLPRVRLSCRAAADFWALAVADNGLGLDLPRQGHGLFQMFERLHAHVEGSGVGLYMVKKIVENAGGRVEVASELGAGSTFTVYLPR